ncbi:uncharacterized protein [Apostichopus japonicus]|uniref:uncharacterized protein isoform X6 n=1 Tax=Stichopus japonicus TaxID=307972 RepID=UPI003AB62D32
MKWKPKIPLHLITLFIINGINADSRLVCPESYLLNVNEQGEVSCDFDSDFISVRWYESGGTPLLRYDGTEIKGPGKDSGEFDMKRDGSMIIRHAKPKHDGIYSVTVLHSDATSSQATVKIIIIVPLESVSVQDCQSEPYDLCKEAGIEERSNTLVCIARGARPSVDLTWQAIGDSYQPQELSNLNKFENTSISTVPYDTKSFTLQNVTCIPNGYAVKNVTGASLLVTGEHPPSESTLNEKNIQQGSQLQIKCPPDSLPLAQLYITLPGHNKHVLMETNVTTLNGHCLDDTCHVEENSLVTFEDISYKQDGIYKCISSDGTKATKYETKVTVLISPANAAVNIEGCESTESCTRNGTKTGSLTCSVSGLRPPVELTMTNDNFSKPEVKLTNHRRETTTDPESGTSKSYLTVDYAIIGCDGTASLTCSARPDKFARKIKPSKITITTGKVKCMDDPVTEKKGKGVLIAGLLIVFAIIAAIVVFLVFWTRKKGIFKREAKQSEETENRLLPFGQAQMNADETDLEVGGASTNEKKEEQPLISTIENQETDMAATESKDKNKDTKQKNADETTVDVEKASFTERDKLAENEALLSKNKTDTTDTESKDKKKDTKQKKVKTPDKKKKEKNKSTKPKSDKAQKKLQEEFNKKFRAIFEMESQVQKERFKDELDKFIAKHGKENTVRLLGVFVKDTQLQDEELIWILECLELEKEENVKSSTETVEILRIIAEKKQVSEKCLEIATQQYLQKKITAREFATITSPLRESHKIDELLKSMDVNKSQKELSSEAVDALVQYAILKPLDVTEQHRNVSYIAATNAASKIKYIKIVQAIQERFGEGNFMTELKAFLKTIAEKVLIREHAIFKENISKILEDSKPTKEEEITSVFVRMLLFSVEKKLIEIEECMEMLQSGLDKHKLTKSVFTELPRYSQTEGCLCQEFLFQILREAVVREKITEIDYFRILEAALNEKQIQISEYMGQLTKSVKDNLIKKEEMMDELRRCAMENLGNEVYYCYQMNYLLKNRQLTYKEYTDELESSVDNNWVKRSHVVEGLQDSLKNKLITEQQLLSQLCQIHVGGKISEHIKALQLSRTNDLISEETLMSQFQELVKKGKLDSEGFIGAIRDCMEGKLISETIFLQQLMLSLLDTTIDFKTYRSQLESCIEKKTLQLETYLSQLDSLWNDKKIEQVNYMGALRNCLIKHLMTTEGFLGHLLNLLKTNKLKYEEVTSELKICFKENLVNDIGFFSQLVSIVKLSKKDLMREHEACLRENLITTNAFREQLRNLVETKELQIKNFVEGLKRCLREKLIDIQFFLSTIHSDLEKKVLNPELFAEQLFDVVKTSELDVTGYINEMRSCLQQGLINQTLFLKELRKASDSGKLNIEGLTSEMENTLEKELISQDEFCENLSDLFQQGKIDQPKIVEQLQVCFEKKWISEDMFLNQLTNLFVNKKMDTNDLMEKLHECVGKKSLKEESFLRHVSSLFIGDKLAKHELMEEYLTCLAAKLISLNVFCEQLRMLLKDKKIETGDYLDTLKIAFERNLIDDKFIISTLRDCLRDKSISEEQFCKKLNNLLEKRLLQLENLLDQLQNCFKNKLIPEKTFVAQIDSLLETKKIDIHCYFTELENCLHHKSISPAFFCEKLNQLLTSSKVDIQGFIAELQNCFLKDLIDQSTVFGQLQTKFVDKKISREVLMEVYHAFLQKQKINVNDYWNELFDLLKNGKISINDFVQELNNEEKNEILDLQDSIGKLHGCRKENLMTEEALCKFLEDLLQKAKLDITEYNTELKKCVDAKLISNEIYSKQIEQQEEKKKIDFREAFKALCTEITSDKGTNDKFQEVLKKFHKKYKESPSNYMEEYIDKEDIAEEQLIAVTKFLAGCEESDLFTISDRTKAIRLAVKKLPPETSLSLLAEIFSLHQITVEEFVAGTKFLLDEKKITAKGILATLKEVSKSKYPGVEIADTVIQFILKNLMNVDEVFRQIGFLGVGKEKIHHPYFLQAIQGIIGDVTVQQKNTLRSLFDKILTKAADNQVIFRDQAINKIKKPDLRKKFLRVLLLNVQNKWMKTDECIAILTASKQKGQINETDLEDISECSINQSWLDKVNTMDLLAECFHASLMSESTYKKSLTSIKKKGKITKDEYADALKICAGKNT